MSDSNKDARLANIEKLLERAAKSSDNNLAFGAGLALVVFSSGVPGLLFSVIECTTIRNIVALGFLIIGLGVVVFTWKRHHKINYE